MKIVCTIPEKNLTKGLYVKSSNKKRISLVYLVVLCILCFILLFMISTVIGLVHADSNLKYSSIVFIINAGILIIMSIWFIIQYLCDLYRLVFLKVYSSDAIMRSIIYPETIKLTNALLRTECVDFHNVVVLEVQYIVDNCDYWETYYPDVYVDEEIRDAILTVNADGYVLQLPNQPLEEINKCIAVKGVEMVFES